MKSMRPAMITIALMLVTASSWAFTIPPAARGSKTISMNVEAGPLELTITKKDLNIYEGAVSYTHLRAHET